MKTCRSHLALAVSASLCLAAGTHAAPQTPSAANPSAQSTKPRLNEAQLAEAQARVDLANQIAQNVGVDAQAKGLDEAAWRIGLLSVLYNTPSGALRDIRSTAKTLDQVHAQAAEAQTNAHADIASAAAAGGHAVANDAVAAGLGSSTDSLVFTPMTPCRFIDTRVVGGPVGTTVRTFDTFLIGPSYGGDGGCKLPGSGEPAFAANVTLVNPSVAAGYLAVRPFGSTNLTSWSNWYQAGTVTANAGIVSTALNGSSHYAFEVLTGGGTTDVVLDYFGYFSASPPTALDCTNTAFAASVLLNTSTRDGNVAARACPIGYTQVATLPAAFGDYPNLTAVIVDDGGAFMHYNGSSSASFTVKTKCCRVP